MLEMDNKKDEYTDSVEKLLDSLTLVRKIPQFRAFMPIRVIEITEEALLNYSRIGASLTSSIAEYYMLLSATSLEASRKAALKMAEIKDDEKARKVWIDVFEQEFNELFRSQRFGNIVNNIITSYADLLKCMASIVEAYFKELGLPTRSEMDSVYREMVKMKRDIANLTEEVKMLREMIERRRDEEIPNTSLAK
ncbi:MAG: poly(R)-hydroxyalkanoic acid synthase subunit PhaE [Candidatus Nitrosocaldus sp.]